MLSATNKAFIFHKLSTEPNIKLTISKYVANLVPDR